MDEAFWVTLPTPLQRFKEIKWDVTIIGEFLLVIRNRTCNVLSSRKKHRRCEYVRKYTYSDGFI